ncbi:MAG: peptide transporter ATP-binding protein [Clostridiales bacterium]|jgi:peptide/nickel transport system ATP-binding protein|nr:peptide transporter ATP-binding protein [Clostridiales bacterium]
MALLSIKDISVTYHSGGRHVKALNGITLDVNEGESLGIVGESGSGKTTLIMAILRLLPKGTAEITGEAFLNGKELLSMKDGELSKIRWEEMALVFQKSMNALSPVHKIGAFMNDIYRNHKSEVSKNDGEKRIKELFELVNLSPSVYDLYPHELSGGMMQRVSIALSLMFNPKLLILDEATTALDVVTQTQILEEILSLEKKLGITRIMITHDISVVASTCKNVAVLYAGHLLEVGPTCEVLVNPIHSYTKGLINSFPVFDNDIHQPLQSIGGFLPDLSSPPPGCIFAPRCARACDICRQSKPEMKKYEQGHYAACHFAGGENNVQGS